MTAPSWGQQLMALKSITQATGAMHEAQLLQLKMWPRVIFDTESVELAVDPGSRKVEFRIELKNRLKPDTHRATQILMWTKQLLGDNWSPRVVFRKRRGKKYRKTREVWMDPESDNVKEK